jgi:hypothetical protein
MPAYEIPNLRFSGEAGGVIARRRFVTVNAQEQIVQVTANTEAVIGASSLPAELTHVAEIYDGIVMIEAGAAVEAGSAVMADASGRGIEYVAGAGVIQAGVAITNAGALGELFSVKL